MKRGQTSIEYVILVGILLFFMIPIIQYALTEAQTNVKVNQLDTSTRRIAKAADTVFSLGKGASEVITITIPPGILASKITGHEVVYTVSLLGTQTDIEHVTKPAIQGSIPILPGTYNIVIRMLETNNVSIEQKTK